MIHDLLQTINNAVCPAPQGIQKEPLQHTDPVTVNASGNPHGSTHTHTHTHTD
jgi:hypothetical protein